MVGARAILLGFIQGLTEFLPVSSSGHLVLAQQVLGTIPEDFFLDIALHMGTLAAVVIFFHSQLIAITKKTVLVLSKRQPKALPPEWKLVIIGSMPVFIIGVVFYSTIAGLFSSPKLLPFSFLFTALLLWSTKEKKEKELKKDISKMTRFDGLVVGFFQALAILPGVSRSGSTYTGGLWRYLKKETAFYFSFLLSIPAIIGAFALELLKGDQFFFNTTFVLGFSSAFLSSLLGLYLFKKVIQADKVHYFAYYLLLVSALSALLI